MPTVTLATLENMRSELVNSKYYLNIRSGYMAPVTLHCSYGDSGEVITFYIFDGGEKLSLDGASATIHGTRRDGANFGPFNCTTSGNTVTFTLQSSMTAVEGSAIAEFTISKSGATIGTCNFGILVENAVFPNGVAYDNDPSVYQDILKYVQSLTSATESEIAVERARIDNYLSSGTAATNSELIDIRVGIDGVTHESAGGAVRSQFEDCLIQRDDSITTSDNIDSFIAAGQWYVTSENRFPSNWPSDQLGRLLVFGDSDDTNTTLRCQTVIDYNNDVYVRIGKSAGWTNGWSRVNTKSLGYISNPSGSLVDANNYPVNSIAFLNSSGMQATANVPEDFKYGINGTLYTTTNPILGDANNNACVQIFYTAQAEAVEGGAIAWRYKKSGEWGPWNYHGYVTTVFRCLATSTGEYNTFTNLAFGIRYLMQSFNQWNEHNRCKVLVDPGTFSLNSVFDYYSDSSVDKRGLFLPPWTTLKGAGKDKTKLTCYYTGNDQTLMFYVSGLNIPYESVVEDLTISVKNLRYTVHSDDGISSMPNVTVNNTVLLRNNQITLRNVKLEHLGFDDGKRSVDPGTGNTYFVPSTWGSGSWDNANQTFINCDFYAKQRTPWLNHNRTSITKPSTFIFESCNFVNEYQDSFNISSPYNSCSLISWGANQSEKNKAIFRNCRMNRFIGLTVNTTLGAQDAVIDYDVEIDNDLLVLEQSTNNSHLNDNYIKGGCSIDYCIDSSGIIAYTPVSGDGLNGIRNYNVNDAVRGIALHSAANGEVCKYQKKGLIYLDIIGATGFSAKQNINYSNGSWVVDNSNPFIKVLSPHVGTILE